MTLTDEALDSDQFLRFRKAYPNACIKTEYVKMNGNMELKITIYNGKPDKVLCMQQFDDGKDETRAKGLRMLIAELGIPRVKLADIAISDELKERVIKEMTDKVVADIQAFQTEQRERIAATADNIDNLQIRATKRFDALLDDYARHKFDTRVRNMVSDEVHRYAQPQGFWQTLIDRLAPRRRHVIDITPRYTLEECKHLLAADSELDRTNTSDSGA